MEGVSDNRLAKACIVCLVLFAAVGCQTSGQRPVFSLFSAGQEEAGSSQSARRPYLAGGPSARVSVPGDLDEDTILKRYAEAMDALEQERELRAALEAGLCDENTLIQATQDELAKANKERDVQREQIQNYQKVQAAFEVEIARLKAQVDDLQHKLEMADLDKKLMELRAVKTQRELTELKIRMITGEEDD